MKIGKTIFFTALSLVYLFVLQYCYINYIAIEFGYLPYLPTIDIDISKVVISYITIIAICLFVPIKTQSCASFLLILCWISIIVPTISLYGIINGNDTCFWSISVAYFCMLLATYYSKNIKIKAFNRTYNRRIEINCINICILCGFAACLLTIVYGGLRYFNINFDFKMVYETREMIRHDSMLNTAIVRYTSLWSANFFLPCAIILSTYRKKYLRLAMAISLQLFLYFIFFHKVFLFIPVFCILVYLFVNKFSNYCWLLFGCILLTMSLYIAYTFEMKELPAMFLRRTFFVPAIANYSYFDFFVDQPMEMFRSIFPFRLFFESPFEEQFQVVIGTALSGGEYSMMNNNFFATGYVHFRELGTIGFALIVGVIIGLFDAVVNKSFNKNLSISLVALSFYTLFTSTDLLTGFWSHGILIAFFFIYTLTAASVNADTQLGFKMSRGDLRKRTNLVAYSRVFLSIIGRGSRA